MEFACHDASCAPPPAGVGGSSRSGGNAQIAKFMAERADRLEKAHLDRIQARRDATDARAGNPRLADALAKRKAQQDALYDQIRDKREAGSDKAPIIQTSTGYPVTRAILKDSPRMFINIASPDTMSGWKAHVHATTVEGTAKILERLAGSGKLSTDDELDGWGAKVATQAFHDFTANGHKQSGKGVTIYFPHRATAERDIAQLVKLMDGLPGGKITGDEMRSPNVGVRYELKPGAPERDLNPHEYHDWYQEA